MAGDLVQHLESFIDAERTAGTRRPWLVAFSGGTDSTALALGLAETAPRRGLEVRLFHVDHALDEGSAARAIRACELARQIGLPFDGERHPVSSEARRHVGTEAAARRVRYAALEAFRARLGADRILTAHHLDDQIETVFLRIAAGSGLAGLQGILRRRGVILRPLLDFKRSTLEEFVAARGIVPIDDPTNSDLTLERNRVRHQLLPTLLEREPGLGAAMAAVAPAAARARIALDRRLERLLAKEGGDGPLRLDIAALLPLPEPLPFLAFTLLERWAGREQPGSTRSKRELLRQLIATPEGSLVLPAAGEDGLYWQASEGQLALAPLPPAAPSFSYILDRPGEVDVPEIRGRIRLSRQPFAPWMRTGESRRAALAFPGGEWPGRVEIRNRRPGDRLRPLGAPGMRRLKDLLIDHKVPRAERERLPLLLVEGSIAWVPGVTIDDRYRLKDEIAPWVVEWLENPPGDIRRIA